MRSAPGSARTILPSAVRTSVATTSCPSGRSGSSPPATPTRATACEEGEAASLAPEAVALARPIPMRGTAPPTARASMRSGDTMVSSAMGPLRNGVGFSIHAKMAAVVPLAKMAAVDPLAKMAAVDLLAKMTGESHHREDQAVQVVVDVEVPREPGAGEPGLVPGPVVSLGAHQELDTGVGGRPL